MVNEKRLLDTFLGYVQIDSETKNEKAMCETISLEVREHNQPAICLYENNGFMEVTKRKGYYADGEDAYLMIKPLGGNYQ
jgi:ribosomal protein S18 acetylase RimI-like enzyme